MTKRVLPQVQAAEMGFLRRFHGVKLGDKVRSCKFCKAVSVESLLRIENSSFVGSAMCPSNDWRESSYWRNPRESGPEVVQAPGGVTTSHTLLCPVLVWSQQNYLKLLNTVLCLESS